MSTLTITYRPALAGDRDWLFELKRATMRSYVAAVYGWDDAIQRQLFDENFDPTRVRIIQADGHDAGMVEVHEMKDHLYLARIEVLPAFQNRGVGSVVIQSILADAARKNKRVQLQVLRPNPARALYERLGFRIWSETTTHFQMTKEPGQTQVIGRRAEDSQGTTRR